MNLSSIASNLSRTYSLFGNEIRLQDGQLGQLSGLGNVTDGALSSSQVRLSGYGRLQSALSVLGDSARKYDTASEVAGYSASSKQPGLNATVDKPGTSNAPSKASKFEVDVTQLAQSQRVQSQNFADADTTQLGGGSLRIQFGRLNGGGDTFTPTGQASRTITLSAADSTLNGIASAVNRANVGISAKVVQDSNGNRLEFTGKNTGADQVFQVLVGDNDGNNTDSAQGLSRLAYDPAGAVGSGRNLSLQRSAQDAAITVDGQQRTSSTNSLRAAVPGVSLSFSATGKATVEIGRDLSQASQAAKALASAYNIFQGQQDDIAQDGLTRKVSAQVDKVVDSSETGSGQNRLTLAQVGLKRDASGKLALDEKQFQQAFSKDAEGVTSLLAKSAKAFETAGADAQSSVQRVGNAALRGLGGDGSFASQALQLQNQLGSQRSGQSYSPTTQNLYGLSQYLSVAGL